jgi:cyclophilin family peptidyl-prolyl cis-trans isomerase/HEAT repeat protein
MERPALAVHILPLLVDSAPAVRAEAANALGQAVYRGEPALVLGPLLDRLSEERDGWVRGVIAETLGRLPYQSTDTVRLVDAVLVGVLDDSATAGLVGAVRGLTALVQRQAVGSPPSERAVARLRELARYRSQYGAGDVTALQIRRMSMTALARSGTIDAGFLVSALADRDAEVRRLAVTAASAADALEGRAGVITRALSDTNVTVRLEAIRAYGRHLLSTSGCGAVVAALDDPDPDVVLTAIDLLGNDCGVDRTSVERLRSIVEDIDAGVSTGGSETYPNSWHRSAHALVALAQTAPEQAAPYLERFATDENWWVRLYAARAAAALDSTERLEILAEDDNDNVRNAAVAGLTALLGHEADRICVQQLTRRDYQLIMTAADALEGTPNPGAAMPALFDALDRVTAERRETSRDARRALLRRIGALGGWSQADALSPYLRDFDPAIAEETARILADWTGRTYVPSPTRLQRLPLPTFADLAALTEQAAVLEMRGGERVVLRLFPFEAPTNVARFVRLAYDGYFDGLTFHRVVPNFVIQGGSPGANEFMGDGLFTRDELTKRSHSRGTVGISTRGRDTGDGQIFVNLVDNPRLDHNYTIIGEVVDGMDVLDGILEGAVIERISWQDRGS